MPAKAQTENNPQETQTPQARTEAPEKELFKWKAQSRPFQQRGREFWVRVLAIAGVFGLILFVIEGVMPVILMITVIFLYYILSTVRPEEIEYKITNKGVKISDKTTEWSLMNRFWFAMRMRSDLLVFEIFNFPGRLELVIDQNDKGKLKEIISKYIPEEEAPPANMDKAADWLSKKIVRT